MTLGWVWGKNGDCFKRRFGVWGISMGNQHSILYGGAYYVYIREFGSVWVVNII